MKILNRTNVVLGASEKKLFALSGKNKDIELLDEQISAKKQEYIALKQKVEALVEVFEQKAALYDQLIKEIEKIDLIALEDAANKHKKLVENAKIEYENLKNLLKGARKDWEEIGKEVKRLEKLQNSLLEQIAQLKQTYEREIEKINVSKTYLLNKNIELQQKNEEESAKLSENIRKSQEILKQALEEAGSIRSKAQNEALKASKEAEGKLAELREQNLLEGQLNAKLKAENNQIESDNTKKKEALSTLETNLKERESILSKRESEIDSIKQQALTEIYRAAKQYKVEKINEEVKKLM